MSRARERMRALIDDLWRLHAPAKRRLTSNPLRLPASLKSAGKASRVIRRRSSSKATVRVQADTAKLRRLLANLLRNSVEHGSTGAQAPADNDTDHSDEAHLSVGVLNDTRYGSTSPTTDRASRRTTASRCSKRATRPSRTEPGSDSKSSELAEATGGRSRHRERGRRRAVRGDRPRTCLNRPERHRYGTATSTDHRGAWLAFWF